MSLTPRVGRDGALRLGIEHRGSVSVLADARFTLPLQVLSPVALDDAACVVSLLNPTGGMVGGDRLTVDVAVAPGAHVCLTTPSANRVYRTVGPPAEQRVRLTLGAGAACEWVPDHTIPSDGAALRQSLIADVGAGATLIAIDAYAAGRVARGEAWRFAELDSTLSVRDAAGPIVHDRFVLAGAPTWSGLGLTEDRPYFAAVVLIGEVGLDAIGAELPALVTSMAGVSAGAARLARRGVLVRCLATDAPSFTRALAAIWALARRHMLGLPPLSLRKL